tara:strand:+ start:69 stop:788 length:720 start_codon:yes stop_codon:yes gene_type:complete
MSGWRSRLAKKKESANDSAKQDGEILRVSKTGFGFIGLSQTARKRYHFKFTEVTSGDPMIFKVGDRVQYSLRMNDSTMEMEAYDVCATGRGRPHQMPPVQRSRKKIHEQTKKSTASGTASGTTKNQKTKDSTDQFGNARAVESGALLDIIDGGEVNVAKCCDDFDINPNGGIGFSFTYQRSRGRIISEAEERKVAEKEEEEAAAAASVQKKAEEENKRGASSWRSRRGGAPGRSLADMM